MERKDELIKRKDELMIGETIKFKAKGETYCGEILFPTNNTVMVKIAGDEKCVFHLSDIELISVKPVLSENRA
jgi:hypothetical protein